MILLFSNVSSPSPSPSSICSNSTYEPRKLQSKSMVHSNMMLLARFSVFSHALSPSSSLSTTMTELGKPRLVPMVNFLVDALGFSEEEAISITNSPKVKSFCQSKASWVLNLLKSFDLNDSQIREIVSFMPNILLCKEETLGPKLRVLRELGVSGSDLVLVLKYNKHFIYVGLHTQIIPGIAFLKELMGSNEKVVEAIVLSRWLTDMNRISANVELLQNYGLSKEKIAAMVTTRQSIIHRKTEWLQEKLHYTEVNLGIPRDSTRFYSALQVASMKSSTVDKKIAVFKEFGWSDSEVYELIRGQPFCLCRSEANLRERLNLYMKELKHPPSYLVRYYPMFTRSLEKLIKPRYEILKILEEKKLVNGKPSLFSLVVYTEDRFFRFMERFEEEVPDLMETYMTIMENVEKAK